MRLSKILFVFLVLGCASIYTQILEETEYIGELISQQPKTEDAPAIQPISPVVEVKSQETEIAPKESATVETKTEETPKNETVVEEEKPKETTENKEQAAPVEETKPVEVEAPKTDEVITAPVTEQETKTVEPVNAQPEITQPAVQPVVEENKQAVEPKVEDKVEAAPVTVEQNQANVEQAPVEAEKPKLEKSEFGVYGFLALVFSFSVMYMAFLIYQQNKKYDFLNHDLHDEMGYELLEDHN